MNWKEFRPTISFLTKFLCFYLVGNLVYGWYVTSFEPMADPATRLVTDQTAFVLKIIGWPTETIHHVERPTTSIMYDHKPVVSVYEGCNGLNVAIIFLSFLFGFGPVQKPMLWFALSGLLIIHISNMVRIALLFMVTLYLPHFVYFTHKYLFTAIIYVVVFLMWVAWMKKYRLKES